ncbi:hypothetical protein D3C81_11730 [compost metagenome]
MKVTEEEKKALDVLNSKRRGSDVLVYIDAGLIADFWCDKHRKVEHIRLYYGKIDGELGGPSWYFRHGHLALGYNRPDYITGGKVKFTSFDQVERLLWSWVDFRFFCIDRLVIEDVGGRIYRHEFKYSTGHPKANMRWWGKDRDVKLDNSFFY